MKVHVLQHVPSEGLGSIEEWLQKIGATVTFTYFFESAALPAVQGLDLVIALGGPMSVNDETDLPWLRAEKKFIREAIDNSKAVLGICLGSQLIANALGARVSANLHKEIGWFPVTAVQHSKDTFQLPASVNVFHWHGETFEMPQGAVHLARSAACENQGFQWGRRVIGLQFHLETTADSARSFVEEDDGVELKDSLEVADSLYIQTAQQILDAPISAYAGINALMVDVLQYLTAE
jgi:GMP synthase-like glutamine amidotransferase